MIEDAPIAEPATPHPEAIALDLTRRFKNQPLALPLRYGCPQFSMLSRVAFEYRFHKKAVL
jgi:hypothetical protein